jgi:hypothetical protein
MRQFALFLWGVGFASLVKTQLPETLAGDITFIVALWAGFYPLFTTIDVPIARYWMALPTAGSLAVGIAAFKDEMPIHVVFGIVIVSLALPAIVLVAQWFQRRRSRA